MLSWLKRQFAPARGGEFRELLFGDVPLAAWAANGSGDPWTNFRQRRRRSHVATRPRPGGRSKRDSPCRTSNRGTTLRCGRAAEFGRERR